MRVNAYGCKEQVFYKHFLQQFIFRYKHSAKKYFLLTKNLPGRIKKSPAPDKRRGFF